MTVNAQNNPNLSASAHKTIHNSVLNKINSCRDCIVWKFMLSRTDMIDISSCTEAAEIVNMMHDVTLYII